MSEFFPIPEEIRQHLIAQNDRHEMALDSYRHEVHRMFDEMSKEHLLTLRHIFHNMSDHSLAAYYEGCVSTTLSIKYNVCPGCGVNHEEQMQEQLNKESEPMVTDGVTIQTLQEFVNGEPGIILDPAQPPLFEVDLTEDDYRNMKDYNLDDAREEGTGKLLGFICIKCGMRYQSIEDRMTKEPDECSGCHQKAMWG